MRSWFTLLSLACLSCCCSPAESIPVHHWSKAEEGAMADAVDALPPDSPLIGPLVEWADLRCRLDAGVCK